MIASRFILALAIVTPALFAEPAMTDRITPEQLAARPNESPFKALKQPTSTEQAKVKNTTDQSILGSSEILTDGSHWTLVPKGAVLFTPPAQASKLTTSPSGQLLAWSEFLVANRGWLATEDITYDQATGKTPLSPDRVAFWPKQTKLIVATHQGGPISVKTPATQAAAAPAATPTATRR